MKFNSDKQRRLFLELEKFTELLFTCGPKGISADLYGKFSYGKDYRGDDQLNVDDGKNHVHIDWNRVKRAEASEVDGEGVLSFLDDAELLFRVVRFEGPFPENVKALTGNLLG